VLGDERERAKLLEVALENAPAATTALGDEARRIENRLRDLDVVFHGDPVVRDDNEPWPPSLDERVYQIVGGAWGYTGPVTQTHRHNYEIASAQFSQALARLKEITADLHALEQKAEAAGAPWTPGRMPEWK